MNILKEEFLKNNKGLIFLMVCVFGLATMTIFVPVRCHLTRDPIPPMDEIRPDGVSVITNGSIGSAECFSILRKEFWTEPTWPLHFVWISSLDNYQLPGFAVTPVVIQR